MPEAWLGGKGGSDFGFKAIWDAPVSAGGTQCAIEGSKSAEIFLPASALRGSNGKKVLKFVQARVDEDAGSRMARSHHGHKLTLATENEDASVRTNVSMHDISNRAFP